MPIHPRPHLTTHNRAAGHSAVAGAAYRLGLRLFDRRTGSLHDYTKRLDGDEIVAAFNVAPDGAPDWALDPDELWNRVEACELRRNSQIARDYVVPIPLGLDDQRAEELVRGLAHFICGVLKTPLSIGIHRDADIDLLGLPKPVEKQGMHAHLLFPTRKILLQGEDAVGRHRLAAKHGFGEKLSALSNRNASSAIVEQMNAQWAALANKMAAATPGLDPDFDHRSYVRLDIDRIPRPHLSRATIALEKKGFFTRPGDRLREIVLASDIDMPMHADPLATHHEHAVFDTPREAARQITPPRPRRASTDHGKAWEASGSSDMFGLSEELARARVRGHREGAALVDRFIARAPMPSDEVGRQLLIALGSLVKAIQRALRTVVALATKLGEHQDQLMRWKSARLDRLFELDEARRQRGAATTRAKAWTKAHGWRVMTSKVLGPNHDGLRALRAMEQEAVLQDRMVQDLKSAQLRIGNEVDLLTQEEIHLQVRLDRAQARLQAAVERFVALDHQAVPALLAVLTARGRTMVENVMPPLPPSEAAVPKVEKGTRLGQGVQVSTAPVRRSRRSRSRISPM